jgi:uncharacterized Ntn-hydrolase superfamily protein
MTYSIVARDPASGRFGVAIQTCWPFVGAGCPWVESGVGAVTTQSFSEVAHGPNGLELLRAGVAPADAVRRLLDPDPGREVRQVGMVGANGVSASFTGARCVEAAGHVTADNVAIQANMMERPTVWPAMLVAWESATGSFVDRLLAALRAAEAEGGDIRGRQAAVLVISGTPTEPAWKREWDIRVDDHRAPLDELERLVRLQLGFDALDRAEERAGAGDIDGAREAGEEALALTEGDDQVMAWAAIGLVRVGQAAAGRAMLREASARNPRWPEFVRRFAASGAQPELVEPARKLLDLDDSPGR